MIDVNGFRRPEGRLKPFFYLSEGSIILSTIWANSSKLFYNDTLPI